ncbi:uncharacterized protein LOC106154583 [Lingula anatina]|uniref:Uncharacterized protein LOC106154583 n=1 Tax=Lingula anatina TaxID=7574 RepID=A0A1S3HHE2_LINAN|nr:uncharacterized protein LOC106154583 [Lingula anatina]|eukprot:XP_013384429.1 uncharacterized protein LOC106154583 [Lingula anatina]
MCIKTTLMKFLLGLCILHFGHLVLAQGVLDADGCDPNPCLHSGSCSIDPVMNYTCSCQLGYVGRNCEISEFSTTSSETITDIGEVSTTVGVNTTTNVTYSSSGASTTFTTTTPSTDTLPWYSTIYDTTTYPTGVSTETPLGTGVSTETPLVGSHGAPCTRTQDCMAGDNNTVCTDTGQCTCNTGLPPYYLDGANLCAPYYNAECSKNTSCLTQITSYYCNDINRCVCGFGLIYNQEMQRCIYGYNQECYSELGCGDSSLVCTGLLLDNTPGSCKCAPGHNFLRGRCRAGSVINSPCQSSCPYGSNTVCVNGTCVCQTGFFHNQTTQQCQRAYNSSCTFNRNICSGVGDSKMRCSYVSEQSGYFCRCDFGHFYNTTVRLCELAIGSSCTSTEQCLRREGFYKMSYSVSCQDTDLDGRNDTCLCDEGHFWNLRDSRCELYSGSACRDGFINVVPALAARRKRQSGAAVSSGSVCVMIQANPMSWTEAVEGCRSHSSNMLALSYIAWSHVPYYSYTLSSAANMVSRYWTSMLLSQDSQNLIWEGAFPHPVNYSERGVWQWSDNQPLPLHGNCVAARDNFNYGRVNLTTEPCDSRLPSVCTHTPIRPELSTVLKCPDGWRGSPELEKCLIFVKRPESYESAESYCSSEGGRLFSPTSSFSRSFAIRGFVFMEVEYARVGVTCRVETSLCKLADGRVVHMDQLRSLIGGSTLPDQSGFTGEGSGANPVLNTLMLEETCLAFDQNWVTGRILYASTNCDEPLPYICELDVAVSESVVEISAPVVDERTETLTFSVSNYDSNTFVTFVKDGLQNLHRTLVPASSTVIYPLRVPPTQSRGERQGYYSIEVWGKKPYRRYSSQRYLLKYSDIQTFTGTMKSSYLTSSPKDYTEPSLYAGGVEHQPSVRQTSFAQISNAVRGIGNAVSREFFVETVLKDVRYASTGGLLIDFRAYVQTGPRNKRRVALPDNNIDGVLSVLDTELRGVLESFGFIPSSLRLRVETWTAARSPLPVPGTRRLTFTNCPDDLQRHTPSNSSRVTWPTPEVIGYPGNITIKGNYYPGHVFPVGSTVVTYTAEDNAGNKATCKFTVDVKSIVKECRNKIPVPDRGTLRCRQPAVGSERCDVTCLSVPSNIRQNPDVPQSYMCNPEGKWEPLFEWGAVKTLACIALEPPKSYRLLFNVEHPGTCVDDNYFKPFVVGELIKWLRDADLCPEGDLIKLCQRSQVEVICREEDRRRRDSHEGKLIVNLALNATFTEENSTDEYQNVLALAENVTNFIVSSQFRFEYGGINYTFETGSPGEEETTCGEGQMKVLDKYCVKCPPGTKYNSLLKTCDSCPENTYQERRAQSVCIKCEGDKTSPPGSFSRFDCQDTEQPTVVTNTQVDISLIIGVTFAVIVAVILAAILVYAVCRCRNSEKKVEGHATAPAVTDAQDYHNYAYDYTEALPASYQSTETNHDERLHTGPRTEHTTNASNSHRAYEGMVRDGPEQKAYTQLSLREEATTPIGEYESISTHHAAQQNDYTRLRSSSEEQ